MLLAVEGIPLMKGETLGSVVTGMHLHGLWWRRVLRSVLSLAVDVIGVGSALLFALYTAIWVVPYVVSAPDVALYNLLLFAPLVPFFLVALLNAGWMAWRDRTLIDALCGVTVSDRPRARPERRRPRNWQPMSPDDPLASLAGGGVAAPLPELEEPPESHILRIDEN